MNSQNNWKKGRGISKFIKDSTGERLIREGPINIPTKDKQPVIGSIRFKNTTGKIIERISVAIHKIKQNNCHISFQITDGIKTNAFRIPIDNMDFLTITQDSERFKQRFEIRDNKLRDKNPERIRK